MATADKKKKNLKLVSFDDGGVRGLSQLEMMQTIMHGLTFETESSDLPCHHFDLMGGSGTGGLITIFFTKFRMSADEAMEEFAKIVEEVYEPEDLEPLERSNCLRQCIEDIMKRRGHPLDMKLCEETQSQQCAGFVLVSLRSNVESPIPLRAYSIRSQTKTPMTVIEAALATCAMPPGFVPLSIGKTKYTKKEYIAAIGTSNPINELIAEADSLFGSDSRVAYLLSMGAGNPGVITLPSSDEEKGFYSTILKMMNDCERTAGAVEERLRESKIYHRLSVKQGMQNHLSDEMLLEMIVTHTAAYIASNEAHEKIKNLVESASVEVGPVTMDQLTGRSAISSEIAEGVKELRSHNLSKQDEEMIAKLKPAGLKCESHVPACLDGTRSDILDQIEAWSMDFEAPNILWLNGHPGVGKSAISATLVEKWHSSGRLGSEFFFQRDRPEQMTANTLWRVVAHDLSRRYPSIRKELLTALRGNEYFITTSQVDIFQALVYKPLEIGEKDISNESSSIIVIDALDECGGLDGRFSNDRRNLLQAIKAWPGLPKKFKLLITSRAEYDIERIFSDIKPYSIEIPSGNAVNDKTKNDIRDFIIYKLNQIKTEYEHLPPDWPGEVILDNLVKDAAGLFLWIDTVMKLLERSEPELTLKKILDGHHGGMPNLYEWILKASFPDPDQDVIDRFRSVLGAIIFARAPLNATSLAQLLSNRSGVTYICNRLKAVIDDGNIIRIRHQSFTDFLLNLDQSSLAFRFRLDRGVENRSLTAHCFRIMQEKLKFNMCHIESSYLKNEKVPDLNSRIKEHIPSHLSYASQFWTSHLSDATVDDEIKAGVRYFMKNQFLYWLEVLSFKKIVDSGLTVLEALADWLKGNNQGSSLAEDMQKFLSAFAGAISQSVPHIYLSALPFSPEHSPVSQQYRGKYPKLLAVRRGGPKTWPAIQNIFHGHLEAVTSVSFSQDGRLLVSGSWDHTIRVWDVATGDKIIGPLKGHFGSVWSVSFSHDGKRIASGSEDKTIRIWDALTGEAVVEPMKGHLLSVESVSFSPDSRRIVSGSGDKKIRVWDAVNGEALIVPFEGHTRSVRSVSFSPDGRHIVSGSGDQSILIWNAETGQTVIGPLGDQGESIRSVSFSYDGKFVAAGSSDTAIRVWSAETGEMMAKLSGHKDFVSSVSFSPDSLRLVSGSRDRTIRIWNHISAETVIGPLRGHSDSVWSVSFSPNGKRVISGSVDKSIRVWDATIDETVVELLEGHEGSVGSVSFSPDGKYIVSGSKDNTIRLWDAATGNAEGEPMKGHGDSIRAVSFSPDGEYIVSGSDDWEIRVWGMKTGETVLEPMKGHNHYVSSVAFSPDGRLIVSGSEDMTIRVWDADTGEMKEKGLKGHTGEKMGKVLKGHTGSIKSISFSQDNKHVVSGSSDHTIRVWNVETEEEVVGPLKGHTGPIWSVSFSPDVQRIISGSEDKTIRIWNAATGEMVVGPFEGHSDSIRSVASSPDGRRIVSGSADNTIRVWDAETGKTVMGPLNGHSGWVNSVSFSPDGRRIVSGSEDMTIRIWDAVTGETMIGPSEGRIKVATPILGSQVGTSGSHVPDAKVPDAKVASALETKPDPDDGPVCSNIFDSSLTEDGWMLGRNSELLFWVPPEIRPKLSPLRNVLTIGQATELDFTNFVHGKGWIHCEEKLGQTV